MEVVYSFKDSFSTTFLAAILTNLFPIVVVLLVLLVHRKGKQTKQRIGKFAMIIVLLLCVVHFYVEVTQLYGLYKKENNRVEGYVEQLAFYGENSLRGDSFVVDGVSFIIYPSANTYQIGYRKPKEDGGVITSNGQKVAIEYVFYEGKKENIIMKLEIAEQSDKTGDQSGDGSVIES